MRFLPALLSVFVVIGVAGPAHADPDTSGASDTDSAFLATLQTAGITYGRADQAIITAKTVCSLIGSGTPSPDVLAELKARNPGLTTDHATLFMGIAARSYCPNQLVPRGAGSAG